MDSNRSIKPVTDEERTKIWDATASYRSDFQPDATKALSRFKTQLNTLEPAKPKRLLLISSIPIKMAVAASFAGLVVLTLAWLLVNNTSQKAIIADLFITTGANENKEISLPDGSTIFMNQNSTLKLTWFKGGNERALDFKGEGFFKVARDPEKPFIIIGPKSKATVLGTSFNYRDYPSEEFADLEVETGEVKFETQKGAAIVAKNERSVVSNNGAIKLEKVNTLNASSWKTQNLTFRKTSLKKVLQDVERHFHVKFDLNLSNISNCKFNASYENETLENILAAIHDIFDAEIVLTPDGTYKISSQKTCVE